MKKRGSAEWMQQSVFVGPALLAYIGVMVLPFVLGIYYSFTDWNGISSAINWVGFANFKEIVVHDANFGHSFWFTFRYAAAVVVIANLLGFLLAFLLSQPLKTRSILRTVFFMPNVLGGLLLGFVWQFVFVRGFPMIGEATHIGFFNYSWLGTPATAFWGLVIVSVWQIAGYLMIIYIAGLANVPGELLEAATIDGAKGWQTLRHIILPLVMPAVTVCLFLSISWSFKSFDLNFSLTNGGPFRSSESVAMDIYFEAFKNNHYGLGAAKALIYFAVIALITLVQVAVTKKREVEM